MKGSMKDFYLLDLPNAYDNYKMIEPGKYNAYIEDAYIENSVLHIGLVYFDDNHLKAIVAKYYLTGKSRIKSLTMLLPAIVRITSNMSSKFKKKMPDLSFDISDEKLVEALKLIIISDPVISVEMNVSYEGSYKNVRIK